MNQRDLFIITFPVLMGYIPLGFAFGILAASKDFSLLEILLSSMIVYAGAGQFLLVALVAQGASFLMVFFYFAFTKFPSFFLYFVTIKRTKIY